MTDPRVARLVRATLSTAAQGDVLRVLASRPRTARQVAWILNAPLADVEARMEKLQSKGMVRVVGQRRRRSGAIDDVFGPVHE